MASSKTEICNLALGHLGVGKEIDDFDTDESQMARAARRFYATALDAVLRDYQWGFALKTADLTEIEEDPNDEWAFSYAYPSDCVFPIRIQSGSRSDTRQSDIPFTIHTDGSSKFIYTDAEDAVLEYTMRNETVELYPSDFVLALSWRLAFYIVPTLTGGDPFKLRESTFRAYKLELEMARANDGNENHWDEQPEGEFTRVR